LKELRDQLIALCRQWELKGTILLSTEGINLFVAGTPQSAELLLNHIRSISGLETLQPKVSESAEQPFNRMLVRIKKEIIAFGIPEIDPARHTSPRLPAKTLKQWLDEGRPIILLDTRNDYEVRLGTFENAIPIGIDHFREFPAAVGKLPENMKDQPVVTFCTGGIRCEKASPFLELKGFKEVFQLEGGILKYFEECGGAHYQGECFVFDQRVGLDPSLHESGSTQCFNCLSPLTEEEQQNPKYVAGKSCPYCFKTSEEDMRERIALRHAALKRIIEPLPGCVPYENLRPMTVPASCNAKSVSELLATVLPHVPSHERAKIFARSLIVDSRYQPVPGETKVFAGERYYRKLGTITEPPVNAHIEIVHEDEALIVLNKAAPLPMHPCGRYNKNTLQFILNELYYPQKPHPAHRLDANTSGLVLVTRSRHFAGKLQPQFARGEVKKIYLARVQGLAEKDQFSCDAPISAAPGSVGSRGIDEESGLPSRTDFTVLKRFRDGTTLLEVQPLTGRTNQIRVHLWQMNMPVLGDSVYLPNRNLGETQTVNVEDAPLCLHASMMEFRHPLTNELVRFEAPAPTWLDPGI
jgi:UPF0176 protein